MTVNTSYLKLTYPVSAKLHLLSLWKQDTNISKTKEFCCSEICPYHFCLVI